MLMEDVSRADEATSDVGPALSFGQAVSLRLAPPGEQFVKWASKSTRNEGVACNAYVIAASRKGRLDRIGERMLVWKRQVVGLGLMGG